MTNLKASSLGMLQLFFCRQPTGFGFFFQFVGFAFFDHEIV